MIEAYPLNPDGQTALDLAGRVAGFLGEARRSLDLALYDVRLPGEPGDVVSAALREAAERGIGAYGGGQTELGVGRDHIQYLAALFHPDTPNDVAPRGFNSPQLPDGMPESPIEIDAAPTGFRFA